MSRIIMLVPLDEDISLTTISLSLIHFFNKNNIKKKNINLFCIFLV